MIILYVIYVYFFRIIAKGGNGGRGLYDHPGGLGSLVRAIFHFQEGDTIFLVIGHSGSNVCSEFTNNFDQCKYPGKNSKISIGGGGGGATYIFKLNPNSNLNDKWEPLLIAGGGGGGNGKFNPNFKLSSGKNELDLLKNDIILIFIIKLNMVGDLIFTIWDMRELEMEPVVDGILPQLFKTIKLANHYCMVL